MNFFSYPVWLFIVDLAMARSTICRQEDGLAHDVLLLYSLFEIMYVFQYFEFITTNLQSMKKVILQFHHGLDKMSHLA